MTINLRVSLISHDWLSGYMWSQACFRHLGSGLQKYPNYIVPGLQKYPKYMCQVCKNIQNTCQVCKNTPKYMCWVCKNTQCILQQPKNDKLTCLVWVVIPGYTCNQIINQVASLWPKQYEFALLMFSYIYLHQVINTTQQWTLVKHMANFLDCITLISFSLWL